MTENTTRETIITKKQNDMIHSMLWYMFMDWGHHKQYALVQIAQILYWDDFDELFDDLEDHWIA